MQQPKLWFWFPVYIIIKLFIIDRYAPVGAYPHPAFAVHDAGGAVGLMPHQAFGQRILPIFAAVPPENAIVGPEPEPVLMIPDNKINRVMDFKVIFVILF